MNVEPTVHNHWRFSDTQVCVCVSYLCCSEEDVLADVSDGAGDHPQANAREDVGVVPLAWVEGPPIRQRDRVEWAAAGKDASTLRHHGAHFIWFRLFDRNSAGWLGVTSSPRDVATHS